MPTKPKLTTLEQLRRDNYWTYAELADQIHKLTRLRRSESTWMRICRGTSQPEATTQRAIDRFLVKRRQDNQEASV